MHFYVQEREKWVNRLDPATTASTVTVIENAPHREEDQVEAHRQKHREPIFGHHMTGHTPPEEGVRRNTVGRVLYTRRQCKEINNKKYW